MKLLDNVALSSDWILFWNDVASVIIVSVYFSRVFSNKFSHEIFYADSANSTSGCLSCLYIL